MMQRRLAQHGAIKIYKNRPGFEMRSSSLFQILLIEKSCFTADCTVEFKHFLQTFILNLNSQKKFLPNFYFCHSCIFQNCTENAISVESEKGNGAK